MSGALLRAMAEPPKKSGRLVTSRAQREYHVQLPMKVFGRLPIGIGLWTLKEPRAPCATDYSKYSIAQLAYCPFRVNSPMPVPSLCHRAPHPFARSRACGPRMHCAHAAPPRIQCRWSGHGASLYPPSAAWGARHTRGHPSPGVGTLCIQTAGYVPLDGSPIASGGRTH